MLSAGDNTRNKHFEAFIIPSQQLHPFPMHSKNMEVACHYNTLMQASPE